MMQCSEQAVQNFYSCSSWLPKVAKFQSSNRTMLLNIAGWLKKKNEDVARVQSKLRSQLD